MKQKPIIRLPKLYNAGGNDARKWFVYYSVRNPKSGKMERFKEFAGLKSNLSATDRYAEAFKMSDFDVITYPEKWAPIGSIHSSEDVTKVVLQIELKKEKKDQVLKLIFGNNNIEILNK